MARIRTIKPEFFQHPDLFDLESKMIDSLERSGANVANYRGSLRLTYIALWCQADREGRFVWSPRSLKLNCLPYDVVDFDTVLDWLERGGYVASYTVDDKRYGWIPSFLRHQHVNNRESESRLPHPKLADQDLFSGDPPPNAPDDWKRPVGIERETIEIDGRKVFVANEKQAPFLELNGDVVGFHTNESDSYWILPQDLHAKWAKAYPNVKLSEEYAKAGVWLEANAPKRKTARGMSQFLNRWLAKQQDRGGDSYDKTTTRKSKVREL